MQSKPVINTVVFDLGGVLVDWNPRYLYRQLFGADEAGMERFLAEVCNAEWNAGLDAGGSWPEAIAEAAARHPDQRALIEAYALRWEEMLGGAIEATVAVLDELRQSGVRLLALTNWSNQTYPVAVARFPFLQWFEGTVVSGAEGLIKPDPAIFALLCKRYAVEPCAAVFVDDQPRNVAAAQQLGFQALHFQSASTLRQDLRALGLNLAAG